MQWDKLYLVLILWLKKKEDPETVLADFEEYLYDPQYKIIGQNLLGFDVYMIAELQRMFGRKRDFTYFDRIYDTRALGKAHREGLEKPKENFLSWQYKIINDRSLKSKVSQIQLLKYFGIDFEEEKLHDALYDIEMCYQIFCELKKAMTQRRGENQAKMLKRFDSDKDGTFSTEEKKAAIPTIKKERKAIHEAALKQFDKDGDGKLSPEEREGVREWVKETYPNAIKMAPAGGRRGNKAGSAPKKGPKGGGQAAE